MYTRILSLGLLLLPFLAQAAYQNISWQNPSPTGDDIYDVAVNDVNIASFFMLVGENGSLATTTDGATWRFRTTNTNADLYGCVISPAIMVAVGEGGTILRSTDGTTWTAATGQTANFRAVTYGLGTFVAVGELNGQPYAATSNDGLVWTTRSTGLTEPLNDIAFLGSTFVVVGDSGAVATSLDSAVWSPVTSFTSQDLVAVAPGQGQFIALGNATDGERIFISQTGRSWAALSAPSSADGLLLNGVAYFASTYVIAADEGKILTGTDAITWEIRQVRENYDGYYLDIVGSSQGWNLVGRGGAIYRSFSGLINWTQYASGAQGAYVDIAQGGGFSVAVGSNGRIAGTANNVTWSNRTSNTTMNLNGVAYGDQWWVTVGEQGTIMSTGQNGDQWLQRSSPVMVNLYDVAYGKNRYYAGGVNGTMITSASQDGSTWSVVSTGTSQDITRIEYLNSIFLAGTANGTVLRSVDGASWSLFPSVFSGQVYGFAWFDDKYWALTLDTSDISHIYSSSDGSSWALVTSQPNLYLNTLVASSSWLAATSYDGSVLSTDDGITWSIETGVLTPGLERLIPYSGGGFLATGDWAKIAQVYIGVAFDVYFGPLTDSGNGWWKSSWLGDFNGLGYPIIYQIDQGFWVCSGPGMMNGENSFWFYDYILGWLWTSDGTYPWYYVNARSSWAYYAYTQNGFRWIYFQNTGLWESVPLSQ